MPSLSEQFAALVDGYDGGALSDASLASFVYAHREKFLAALRGMEAWHHPDAKESADSMAYRANSDRWAKACADWRAATSQRAEDV